MYLEVVEEWKRREEALISEEEKQSLTEALIKMLPENGQSYVIDGKESRVDSLQRYGEFFADTGVFFSGSMPGRNPKQQSRRQRRAC